MTTEELVRKLRENKRVRVYLSTPLNGVRLIDICNDSGGQVFGISTAATNWLECEYYRPQLMANSFAGADREYISSLISQYLNTPVSKRKLEKKYRLVLAGDDSNLCWVIGVIHSDLNDDLFDDYWAINNENYLKKKGYQTRFTDADLKKIADGDQDMLDRLTVLKREAPDNAD